MNKMQLILSDNDGLDKNHVQHPGSSKNQNDQKKSGGQHSCPFLAATTHRSGQMQQRRLSRLSPFEPHTGLKFLILRDRPQKVGTTESFSTEQLQRQFAEVAAWAELI